MNGKNQQLQQLQQHENDDDENTSDGVSSSSPLIALDENNSDSTATHKKSSSLSLSQDSIKLKQHSTPSIINNNTTTSSNSNSNNQPKGYILHATLGALERQSSGSSSLPPLPIRTSSPLTNLGGLMTPLLVQESTSIDSRYDADDNKHSIQSTNQINQDINKKEQNTTTSTATATIGNNDTLARRLQHKTFDVADVKRRHTQKSISLTEASSQSRGTKAFVRVILFPFHVQWWEKRKVNGLMLRIASVFYVLHIIATFRYFVVYDALKGTLPVDQLEMMTPLLLLFLLGVLVAQAAALSTVPPSNEQSNPSANTTATTNSTSSSTTAVSQPSEKQENANVADKNISVATTNQPEKPSPSLKPSKIQQRNEAITRSSSSPKGSRGHTRHLSLGNRNSSSSPARPFKYVNHSKTLSSGSIAFEGSDVENNEDDSYESSNEEEDMSVIDETDLFRKEKRKGRSLKSIASSVVSKGEFEDNYNEIEEDDLDGEYDEGSDEIVAGVPDNISPNVLHSNNNSNGNNHLGFRKDLRKRFTVPLPTSIEPQINQIDNNSNSTNIYSANQQCIVKENDKINEFVVGDGKHGNQPSNNDAIDLHSRRVRSSTLSVLSTDAEKPIPRPQSTEDVFFQVKSVQWSSDGPKKVEMSLPDIQEALEKRVLSVKDTENYRLIARVGAIVTTLIPLSFRWITKGPSLSCWSISLIRTLPISVIASIDYLCEAWLNFIDRSNDYTLILEEYPTSRDNSNYMKYLEKELQAKCFSSTGSTCNAANGAKYESLYDSARVLYIALFGSSIYSLIVVLTCTILTGILSYIFFDAVANAEDTFRKRMLYAKFFSKLTSSRRSKIVGLPHFRLYKVDHIKVWLSLRARRANVDGLTIGPYKASDITANALVLLAVTSATIVIMRSISPLANDDDDDAPMGFNLPLTLLFGQLADWFLFVWAIFLGIFMLRFTSLASRTHQKYENTSVLLTEQLNVFMKMLRKPQRKEELGICNNMLKVAIKLLRELEGSGKKHNQSGALLSPFVFNLLRVILLSGAGAVSGRVFGFKVRMWKL